MVLKVLTQYKLCTFPPTNLSNYASHNTKLYKSRKKLRRKKLEIFVMHVIRGPTILGVTNCAATINVSANIVYNDIITTMDGKGELSYSYHIFN